MLKTNMLDAEQLRKDFPLLQREIHGKSLVYLDNASTTQKPVEVLESMERYYSWYNANIHRGVYVLSEEATLAYEQARQKVADFIHADYHEIIFTKGTTESLNLLAYSLG
ncbi:MAG: aminotransferase class V-fold PLP-dependent enzyme, partial [Nanoarchaeota archaeon]